MKALQPLSITLLLHFLTPTTSSIVASSTGRLPQSLSTVISDLEAEGVSHLSTATFLSTRSVSHADRSYLFRSLFSGEEDYDLVTTFGKKFGEDEEEEAVGVVVANPWKSDAAEVASTVLATHGTVIFIVSPTDLERGEGLFESLAPAVERLLSHREETEPRAAELIVIFLGKKDGAELNEAKAQFRLAAAEMLQNVPTSITALEDVFDSIEYLTSDSAGKSEVLMHTLIEGRGQLLNPEDAAKSVYDAVSSSGLDDFFYGSYMPKLSVRELAAFEKYYPASRVALQSVRDTIRKNVYPSEEEAPTPTLVPDFGNLCQATIQSSLETLDESIGKLCKIALIQRKRTDLQQQMIQECEPFLETQLEILSSTYFDNVFRKELSKLRLSPTLPQDMNRVVDDTLHDYKKALGKLLPNFFPTSSYSHHATSLYKQMKEYATDRLRAAKVSGSYKPPPRKAISVGLHWLLPKPFGNDYRLNARDVYLGDGMVYTPKDKVTEIGEGVEQGDWRRCVVPVPSGVDMMYQSGTN